MDSVQHIGGSRGDWIARSTRWNGHCSTQSTRLETPIML